MIKQTEDFVKGILSKDASGHDWYHVERVRNMALRLQKAEGGNPFIIEIAALLHDVADEKMNENEIVGLKKVTDFLQQFDIPQGQQAHILSIIKNMSFKGGHGGAVTTIEGKIVQDADRLDAIGAIAIARTFAYGSLRGDAIYDPNIPIRETMTKEEYRKEKSTSFNHFFEKLLKLKDLLNTNTAKEIATERHEFMFQFTQQFLKEWNGQS